MYAFIFRMRASGGASIPVRYIQARHETCLEGSAKALGY